MDLWTSIAATRSHVPKKILVNGSGQRASMTGFLMLMPASFGYQENLDLVNQR